MTEKTDELKLWFDKDTPPYVRGENPYYDQVIAEIAESLVKAAKEGKFKSKDGEDNK